LQGKFSNFVRPRFAKALYLLSGTEGSNPSLTVVLSAFPLQWLIYGLSTPQSPRRNEAQRNARKCQKSFKFFSSAKTLGKPGKCVHKGLLFLPFGGLQIEATPLFPAPCF